MAAINEFDRTVGLHRGSDVAQHGSGGKLAFEARINAFTVALSMEESADADLGVDLLGRNFHLTLGGVAAIAFARDVLRVIPVSGKSSPAGVAPALAVKARVMQQVSGWMVLTTIPRPLAAVTPSRL